MEEPTISRPSMVSRLPKFGARSQGGSGCSGPIANGLVQPAPASAQEGKSTPQGRQNGMVRMSPFSMKWRKEGGSSPAATPSPEDVATQVEDGPAYAHGQRQQSPMTREIKKPSTPMTKARKLASTATPTSPKAVPQASKYGPRGAAKLGQNSPSGSKPTLNGLGGGGASGRFGSGLLRPRAGSGSCSTASSSRDSLSQSSDSLKSSLSLDNMVRSQSFTHIKQLPSPTGLPIPRSFSFNKAVELAKPLADTQLRAKTPLLKPSALGGIAGGRGLPGTRPGVAPGCSTPPSPIKKLLLPNCLLSKPSSLGYKLSRPTLGKLPSPLTVGRGQGDQKAREVGGDSSEASPVTSDPLSEGERVQKEQEQEPAPPTTAPSRCLGEGLEDMSLSSASSLERNDTSEEYLDDFDNLGDGGGMLLLPDHHGEGLLKTHPLNDTVPDNRLQGTPTCTRLLGGPLTDEGGWAGVDLAGCGDDPGPLALSPDGDFPQGSSLELSPSNSSAGTYMWDEEGLEPLGHTHPCGSYDSDLNSMDILDHLESCDLEDDDLMLDADLPEDGSLHSDADGMSHFEHSERGGRQGHWRRRQHRWSGSDNFHNDNRGAVFQQFHGYPGSGLGRMGSRPLQTASRRDGHTVALDELTLKHMAQDCTSVKNQLLKLKSLLQMEDGGVVEDELSGLLTPESSDENSTSLQVEELMREVQELRDELRRKEKTITQLTQQVSAPVQAMRCQCHQRAPMGRGERRAHHDKSTQTPWRGQAGVLPSPLLSPCQAPGPGTPRASMPHRRQTSNTSAFQTLPQRAPPPAKTSKLSPLRGPL